MLDYTNQPNVPYMIMQLTNQEHEKSHKQSWEFGTVHVDKYDADFLGIMGGILDPEAFFKETGGVI